MGFYMLLSVCVDCGGIHEAGSPRLAVGLGPAAVPILWAKAAIRRC